MKPREVQSYDALAEEIWKSAQALLGFNFVAQRQWYEQTFCLAALGDSLAVARNWDLSGLEAIEYALILRHSWFPDQIRQMTPRDKWLSLHEELNQAPLVDERTGEKVSYLFQFRGKRMGAGVINRTIIPMLCAKAGVPLDDSRGRITSHRGRASVVTALASVPQGMSLMELMQWSGHSSPSSTLHYIRIRPTKLAASFVRADQMSHMVSVLIDHDVIARHSSDPYTFYDLGDSYCSNPFWSSCPHRMACAGCDFNVPKASARAQALESKASIGHYLEAVPLTADERAIVEGDLAKLDGLIRKLDDVPTLDGRTPSQIEAKKNR
ncbi:integrase [Pseudomonas avellanae]|uniref:Integrase n=1 Tax=Pseudomonas avellanae TaxID=46257 RepID=A0AAD0GPC5_9PSED|nr:integrase [Pseudomonas avellanae]AVB18697.1 integrase [Pseudomonas avellanae]